MVRAALKIVHYSSFREEEISVPEERSHSLHTLLPSASEEFARLAEWLIQKYSPRAGTVLDPFCGFGAVPVAAALCGRFAIANDIDPFACRIVPSKLYPADLTEITLQIQEVDFKRPVDLKVFHEYFAPFYDLETFREISSLRAYIAKRAGRVARFMELLALHVLHGPSGGFLSTYTLPQVSLSPEKQEQLNIKRKQSPDYRPVAPRLLKRAAASLRDGIPSLMLRSARESRVVSGDARSLDGVTGASVDLVLTRPPSMSGARCSDRFQQRWLKSWFVGMSQREKDLANCETPKDRSGWEGFFNETLLEMARVLKPGGKAVLFLDKVPESLVSSIEAEFSPYDGVLELVEGALSRFFEAEIAYKVPKKVTQITSSCENSRQERVLVLRRR